uniref:PH domain-containing protein n=1 Tax=Romanomermis culicivorax TaxID=13658 RepID=A0A915I0Z6_ROMCU
MTTSNTGAVGHVIHEGWLIKSPSKPFVFWKTNWTKRYFVLMASLPPNNSSCLLCFYDAEKTKLRKQINLSDCEQVDAYLTYTSRNAKVKYDWIFDVRLQKNKRVHYFAAQSEQEMNYWVSLLCKACNLQKEEQEETDDDERSHFEEEEEERVLAQKIEKIAVVAQQQQNNDENSLDTRIPLKSGGCIDTKQAKGYIPLTTCLSGPQRPNRKATMIETTLNSEKNGNLPHKEEFLHLRTDPEMQSPFVVVSSIPEMSSPYQNDDDVPPSFPPPPLPSVALAAVVDDETSSDSVFIADDQDNNNNNNNQSSSIEIDNSSFHKREKSNDSTISLCSLSYTNVRQSENEVQLKSSPNYRSSSIDGSSSNISDTSSATSPVPSPYGNVWRQRSPTLASSDLLSVTVPPPRPPKRSGAASSNLAQGFVSKEPELHLMYKNEISVAEENDDKYDKPKTYNSRNKSLEKIAEYRTPFNENQQNDESYSSVKIPPIPVPRSSLPTENNNNNGNIYRNVVPPSKSLFAAGDSVNGGVNRSNAPPVVDRSLKPNRCHAESAGAFVNSPKDFTPYIPSRLPKQRSSNRGGGPSTNRRPPLPLPSSAGTSSSETPPMIDLSRKQSFTRRREGSSSSVNEVKYGSNLKSNPRRREPIIVETPTLPIQIDYLEVESPSTSKSTANNVAGGATVVDHHNVSPQTPAATKSTVNDSGEAKFSYVLICEPKTQALLKTKFEQDKLYKKGGAGGTLGKNLQI